ALAAGCRRVDAQGAARRRSVLRLRRHFLYQISRDLRQDGRGQSRRHCRDRRRHAARRRYGLPSQHGGQAHAARQGRARASRRRSARRHDRRGPADRRCGGGALMQPTSHAFKDNAHEALGNANLQKALSIMRRGFPEKRAQVIAKLPEWEALRDQGRAIKDHVLDNLDFYLETFERNVVARGGQVHWCRTPKEACDTVLAICRRLDAKTVTKGKSMIAEEIALNDHLEANGITPVETDLGEYIIQLRKEYP